MNILRTNLIILKNSIIGQSLWEVKIMTLKDFLKRVDIEKDGDKMLLWCDYVNVEDGEVVGWSNLEIEINELDIQLLPSKNNSPFSSDN